MNKEQIDKFYKCFYSIKYVLLIGILLSNSSLNSSQNNKFRYL